MVSHGVRRPGADIMPFPTHLPLPGPVSPHVPSTRSAHKVSEEGKDRRKCQQILSPRNAATLDRGEILARAVSSEPWGRADWICIARAMHKVLQPFESVGTSCQMPPAMFTPLSHHGDYPRSMTCISCPRRGEFGGSPGSHHCSKGYSWFLTHPHLGISSLHRHIRCPSKSVWRGCEHSPGLTRS